MLVNDAAVFVCAADGWPRPRYTWFKDGKLLDLTSHRLKLHREHNSQHLVILHAQYSDAGEYKCLVSNALGSVELSSRLKVVKGMCLPSILLTLFIWVFMKFCFSSVDLSEKPGSTTGMCSMKI